MLWSQFFLKMVLVDCAYYQPESKPLSVRGTTTSPSLGPSTLSLPKCHSAHSLTGVKGRGRNLGTVWGYFTGDNWVATDPWEECRKWEHEDKHGETQPEKPQGKLWGEAEAESQKPSESAGKKAGGVLAIGLQHHQSNLPSLFLLPRAHEEKPYQWLPYKSIFCKTCSCRLS